MRIFRSAVLMTVMGISLVLVGAQLSTACRGDTCDGSKVKTPENPKVDVSTLRSLHAFSGEDFPRLINPGFLLADDTELYGELRNGGPDGLGLIFFLGKDGDDYRVLHSFTPEGPPGQYPVGLSLLEDGILYGVTAVGGAGRRGTVFSMEKDGGNLSLLHSFTGGEEDGYQPTGALVASGTTLFGMTWYGGAGPNGVVYSLETDGNGFSILHSFLAGGDGCYPSGSLALYNGKLYGMTEYCGLHGGGIVFSIGIDGRDYSVLHSFAGGLEDGWRPTGSIIRVGNALFGMTEQGGAWNRGVIFSLSTDGSGFSITHSFDGCDGGLPTGAQNLQACGSRLCGAVRRGGTKRSGVVFSLEQDGNDFRVLHDFDDHVEGSPQGILFHSGVLYGFAFSGSPAPVPGRVYRLTGFQSAPQ